MQPVTCTLHEVLSELSSKGFAMYVARMEDVRKMYITFWSEKLKERDHAEDLATDGNINFG
jgi:hypothetical protein